MAIMVGGKAAPSSVAQILKKLGIKDGANIDHDAAEKLLNVRSDKILGEDDLADINKGRAEGDKLAQSEFVDVANFFKSSFEQMTSLSTLLSLGGPTTARPSQGTKGSSGLLHELLLQAKGNQNPQVPAAPAEPSIDDRIQNLEFKDAKTFAPQELRRLAGNVNLDNRKPIPDSELRTAKELPRIYATQYLYDPKKNEFVYLDDTSRLTRSTQAIEQRFFGESAKIALALLAEHKEAQTLQATATKSGDLQDIDKAIAKHKEVLAKLDYTNPTSYEKRLALDSNHGLALLYGLAASKTSDPSEKVTLLGLSRKSFEQTSNEENSAKLIEVAAHFEAVFGSEKNPQVRKPNPDLYPAYKTELEKWKRLLTP